jgi:hypothetical protein
MILFLTFVFFSWSITGQELFITDINKNAFSIVRNISEQYDIPATYVDYYDSSYVNDKFVELPMIEYSNGVETFVYDWPMSEYVLSRWVSNCLFGDCYEMVNSLRSLSDMKKWSSRFNITIQIISEQKPKLNKVAMLLPSIGISHVKQPRGNYNNVTFITNVFGKTMQLFDSKLNNLLKTMLPPIIPFWSVSRADVREVLYEFAWHELQIHIDEDLSTGWIQCSNTFPKVAFIHFRANETSYKTPSIHMFNRSVHFMLETSGGPEVYDWVQNATSGLVEPHYRRSSDEHGTVSANRLWSYVRSSDDLLLYVYDSTKPSTCIHTNFTFDLDYNDHESLPEEFTPGQVVHYRDGRYYNIASCDSLAESDIHDEL